MQRLLQLISYLNAVFLVKYRSYNDQTDYSLHFFSVMYFGAPRDL